MTPPKNRNKNLVVDGYEIVVELQRAHVSSNFQYHSVGTKVSPESNDNDTPK